MDSYNASTTGEEIASKYSSQIANKTILITGATPKGLGATFALIIAKHNPANIILASYSEENTKETVAEIAAIAPSVNCISIRLDLSSIKQVRDAAEKINALGLPIDVLVNNAGIMACPYSKTVDGIERQFATNFVGHFLLTNLLLPKMLARNVPDGKTYDRLLSYSQSKSANMLFSLSLAEKLGNRNLVSVSLHPGAIFTNLARDFQPEDFADFDKMDHVQGYLSRIGSLKFKDHSQGVATHVFAAFHPSLDSKELNGRYFEDSHVVKLEEIPSFSRDPIDAEKLWKLGEKLVGQEFVY